MNGYFEEVHREIAESERWLARHPTEGPSPESLLAARQAVRAELARSRQSETRTWRSWHGAVGAAAAIAACVTVVWIGASRISPTSRQPVAMAATDIAVPAGLARESTELTELEEGLTDLEAMSSTLLDPAGLSLYDAWEAVLSGESDTDEGNAGASARPRSGRISSEPRLG